MGTPTLDWKEGGHGVDRLVISTADGSLTFKPSPALGAGTGQKPFDRPATLRAAKSLAEAFLRLMEENPDTHRA